jgi:hypothetical protein
MTSHSRVGPTPHFSVSLVTVATLSVALSGCDRAGASDDLHLDGLGRLTAVEELRIGDFDDPNVGFSQVGRVDVDDDGNVYILESSVPEVRVYSPDGILLHRIGRRGGGPGEFEGAPRFGVIGDTVWTVDTRVGRISLFDREGKVLSSGTADRVMMPMPTGTVGYLLPWSMLPSGNFTSHFGMVGSNRNAPPYAGPPTDSVPVPFLLFGATGAVTDTVGWADRPPPRMWRPPSQEEAFQTIQVGDRRMMVPRPPTTLPWWEPLLDGYVLVESPLTTDPQAGLVRVTRIGLTGDTVYSRELDYRPMPYVAADLDSMAARAARGGPGGGVPFAVGPNAPPPPSNWQGIARTLRDAMDFPEFKLPIAYPWVGKDESVWLRRDDGDEPMGRWVVMDDRAVPRGELELPSNLRLVWSRGDTFWAVLPDEFDVPWVVRYRIQ